ncbi:MAG: FtsX-like permease family protein [Fibrella sp.]|nr:FtsX-like permease family protein [Armatimonadota bacterium]
MTRSLPFLLGEALRNLRRHALMTVAAISAIAVALTLIGAFALAFYEASEATNHALSEFEMRVFVRRGVARDRARLLQKRIAALPGVESVVFLTREEIFQKQADSSALDVTGIPNFMTDTLNVRLSDADAAKNVTDTIGGFPEVDEVQAMEQELQTFLHLGRVARTVGLVAGVILLLAALAVVANTVRLSVFMRRREIKIMQIVGASAAFIRLPLLLEGFLHGLAGGGIAALTLWSMGQYVGGLITGNLPQFTPYATPVDFVAVTAYLLLSGAILGGTGSVLAIRRYMKG